MGWQYTYIQGSRVRIPVKPKNLKVAYLGQICFDGDQTWHTGRHRVNKFIFHHKRRSAPLLPHLAVKWHNSAKYGSMVTKFGIQVDKRQTNSRVTKNAAVRHFCRKIVYLTLTTLQTCINLRSAALPKKRRPRPNRRLMPQLANLIL